VGGSENGWDSLFEDAEAGAHAVLIGQLAEPAGGFIEGFEGELEGAEVHRDEPLGLEVFEGADGLVRAHMDAQEGFGLVGADGQEGNLGLASAADLLESMPIGAVAGVVDSTSVVFEDEAAEPAILIVEDACAPMAAGGEGDLPSVAAKGLPPLELDDAAEAEAASELAHAPGHEAELGGGDAPQGAFMEMVEVGMGQQDQIDGRQIANGKSGALEAFEQEKPVGEDRVDEDVEVGELDQKRRVADPGDGDLVALEAGEDRDAMAARAFGPPRFPDHLAEEGARAERPGGRQVLEGTRKLPAAADPPGVGGFWIPFHVKSSGYPYP